MIWIAGRLGATGAEMAGMRADEFLVERIAEGDQDAWRQLIERYSGRLLAFARSRIASLADAEDLVQEALVGFLQSLPHFDRSRDLETYLFTILRYKISDQFRKRKLPTVSAPGDGEESWDQILPGNAETPSHVAAQAEARSQLESTLADLLRKLIHELRDRGAFTDLQVIELLFYGDKRNLDVADLLEMDQKAVAGIKFRAIQKLRKFIEADEGAGEPALEEGRAEVTVARVWREQRLTCLKRSTLGSYLLGVLEEPWQSYTQFHLDVVGCPMCLANMEDLAEEDRQIEPSRSHEAMFASSVGFLSRPSADGA